MYKVVRTSSITHFEDIYSYPFQLKHYLFHSSPILERKRRTNNWDSRFSNHYNNRARKIHGREQLLQNVSVMAEELFRSWKYHDESYRPLRFTKEFVSDRNRERRSRSTTGPKPGSGRRFDFCEDDEFDVEDMFRAAFRGNKNYSWSFTYEEPEREYTSRYNTRRQRNWRLDFDDEYESSEESNCSAATDLSSYRRALGLKVSGPLCLEDVKNAYRACALKWHPDRHQGSSKATAEEKFKVCSAAYQSLCDQMVG